MIADFRKALLKQAAAQKVWTGLTPVAKRDFLTWITSAKQAETRKRRIEKACDMLVSGKRRPCCYAVVPMDLYTALDAFPKAKATWKSLTPDARRDFTDWIAAGGNASAERITKACAKLAAGKRRP